MLMTSVRRRALSVAGSVAAAALTVAGSVAAAPSALAASGGFRPLGVSVSTTGGPTAGALFANGLSGQHTCSGTVVSSSNGGVVLTAAHCISSDPRGWQFAPGYRNGTAPYGAWTVAAGYIDPRWNGGRNSRYDVAVLRLTPKYINGAYRGVTYLTGSTILASSPGAGTVVDIVGYPIGVGGNPRGCSSTYSYVGDFGLARCTWMPSGVSGSGFRYGNDGHGHQYVGGVLGGYHQGGCSVDEAYTVRMGPWVNALVSRAERRLGGDVFVYPVGDGCWPGRP